MTPAQLMQRLPKPEATPPPVVLNEGVCTGNHYTSSSMEDDFSVAIDLLMSVAPFLRYLEDADQSYNLLGEKNRDTLKQQIATLEDFIGQWPT